jgi:MraZ protein
MAFLIGDFETVIDGKKRLAINASFRDLIDPAIDGENWILILGLDRHLWLYPDLAYRRMIAQVQPSPLPDRDDSNIGLLYAMGRYLKSDSQGRVVLPEKSMERASLGEQVTLVGANDHIEIWPTEEWDRHLQHELPRYGEALMAANHQRRASSQAPSQNSSRIV